jgi:hypothetical protein
VRDFAEVAQFVVNTPHNVFRPGFLEDWKSPFLPNVMGGIYIPIQEGQ